MFKLNLFDKISFFTVIIGALNWGFIGLINFNFLYSLVNGSVILTKIIYVFILIAAVNLLYLLFKSNIIKFKE